MYRAFDRKWSLLFSVSVSLLLATVAEPAAQADAPIVGNAKAAMLHSDSFCTLSEEAFSALPNSSIGGMTGAQVFTKEASLNLFDYPVGYLPPVGPKVDFRANYNYLEALSKSNADFPNLGKGWTLNWIAFLNSDVKGNVFVSVPGGGTETYRNLQTNGKEPKRYKHNLSSHSLLVARNDGNYERLLPDGSLEVYSNTDKAGRKYLTELKDPAGNAAKISYDNWFRASSITDTIGQVSKIKYASDLPTHPGFYKIVEISDPFARSAKFAYDKDFRLLVSITDTIGLTSKYSYASPTSAVVTALTTPYGVTRFDQYKPKDSPDGSLGLKITFADGTSSVTEHWSGDRHSTYQWNRMATALYPSDPEKQIYEHCKTTKWMLQPISKRELSLKTSVKEPLETEVLYSYEGQSPQGFTGSSNLPTAISRLVGNRVQNYRYQYNQFGHVLKQVDPLGRSISYRYAANGIDLLEKRQTRGTNNVLLAKFEYDSRHNPTRIVDASGNERLYEYNKFGQVIKTTDESKSIWTSTIDPRGFVTAVFGPDDLQKPITKITYDKCGRVESKTLMNGNRTAFEYDAADRVTKRLYPDGAAEVIKYDKLDAVFFQDRAGKITKRVYDSLDRMVSLEDPSGRIAKYDWCLCGSLRRLTDPSGKSTEWHHDIAGRLIQKKYADGREIKLTYEERGHRLHSKTDALNQKTKYVYNLDDTVASISYENAVHPTSPVSFVYDPDYSILRSAKNELGTLDYDYYFTGSKGVGGIRSIKNSAIPNSEITFEYDSQGRLSSRSINGGSNTVKRAYDSMDRLISEQNVLGDFKFQYGDAGKAGSGRLASISYPNGSLVNFEYQIEGNAEHLHSIVNTASSNNSILSQFNYLYDKDGQIIDLQEQFDGKNTAQYNLRYDKVGQLTDAISTFVDASTNSKKYHYEYDSSGNRLLADENGTIRRCGYNSMNELITMSTDLGNGNHKKEMALKYDANGNLLFDGKNNYQWNAENKLVHVDSDDGTSSDFRYNAAGQLEMISEKNAKESKVKQLLWHEQNICEEREGDKIKKLYALGEQVDGVNRYYMRDHLGSVRQAVDKDGKVVARMDYDPFGTTANSASESRPGLQYAGYYKHEPSGLYVTANRFYDSKLGRWLSRDPAGEFGLNAGPNTSSTQGKEDILVTNLYAYVGNNTMNYVDPLGLQADARGHETRYVVSDVGQNTQGRIYSISYVGESQGVTIVDQPPVLTLNQMAPQTPVDQRGQYIPIGPAPTGYGLAGSIPFNGFQLGLRLVTKSGFGIYGFTDLRLYYDPKTQTGWQIIPNGYSQVVGTYGKSVKPGPMQCVRSGPQGYRT